MKGFWHAPALAFVLGGVLSNQSGFTFFIILIFLSYWIYSYRLNRKSLLFIASFLIAGYFYLPPLDNGWDSFTQKSPWIATIISNVKETPHAYSMTLQHDSGEKFIVRFFKEDNDFYPSDWRHGAICTLEGSVESFAEARNHGQFDYQSYMAKEGIYKQVIIEEEDNLHCEGGSWLSLLYDARNFMKDKVEKNTTPEAFAWMKALVFGETDHLDETTIQWFREYNLSHILAISGLHVGLTIGGIYFLLYRTGFATKTQVQVFLLLLLPFYTFLAGAAPSVIRAGLMAVILILTTSLKWKFPLTDILSIAAIVLLLTSPSYFHHIGFQFSFLVTFSLVLSMPILKRYKNAWIQSLVIGLISQLSILSLQVHYFFEFQPLSLWVNFIMVPYFSFIVIPFLMFTLLLVFLIPSLAQVLSSIFITFHERFLSFVHSLTLYMDFSWVIGKLPPLFIILYTIFLVVMMRYWSEGKDQKAFVSSMIAVGVIMVHCAIPFISDKGTVTMLDVGQGDSFVIELPNRRGVILIDAAGPPIFSSNSKKTAEDIIIPFLKSQGIGALDALFISHKDSDHSGSVRYLLEEFNISHVIVSPYYNEFYKEVEVKRVMGGQKVVIEGQEFNVLHPAEQDYGEPNDNSLVLESNIGGKKWLFTGDISTNVENQIIESYPSLKVDILKVGHHGSNTSTSNDFLNSTQPEVGLISAGVDNRYGHPHDEVVQRFKERGTPLLQTKRHGEVQYIFSGQSGTFSTFLPYNASRE
ncbi:competence protein ComEC [Halobacillus dabanensis]|uniref:Competence protein ComEC n=1 Tax=Halobacillus dabanensis TaxID=240302 RepID=A0A1I3PBW7_HALDA|nr:DNA internalization-related competence protein ComEC/Rec2 [Halobacillus dabanensis]SFJ19084.1 competence protein ComEC [Halobacillus dabanensis]